MRHVCWLRFWGIQDLLWLWQYTCVCVKGSISKNSNLSVIQQGQQLRKHHETPTFWEWILIRSMSMLHHLFDFFPWLPAHQDSFAPNQGEEVDHKHLEISSLWDQLYISWIASLRDDIERIWKAYWMHWFLKHVGGHGRSAVSHESIEILGSCHFLLIDTYFVFVSFAYILMLIYLLTYLCCWTAWARNYEKPTKRASAKHSCQSLWGR